MKQQKRIEYIDLFNSPVHDDSKIEFYDITDEGLKKGKHRPKGLVKVQ